MEAWTPAEPLPANLSRTEIDGQLAAYTRGITPASPEVWATQLDRLYLFAAVFKVPMDNVRDTTELYKEACADIPPSLVKRAIDEALKTWKWGNRLPMPAELRAPINEALERRKRAHRILTMAKARAAREAAENDARKKEEEAAKWWAEKAAARGMTVEALKAEAEAFRARLKKPVDNEPKTPVEKVLENAIKADGGHDAI